MAGNKPGVSPFLKQCFVTLAVGMNLIAHGCVTGFPAILLPQLHHPDSTIVSSKTTDSWIASVFAITLLIGNFLTPGIMDRFGRKIAHYIVSALSVIAWFMTSLAGNVEVIIVGRIIGGISFGMMLPLRSILIGEYSSPKYRGSFLSIISVTLSLGMFYVHLLGSVLSWSKTALIVFFLPLSSFIMTFFIPESPSYLVLRGRYDDCRKAFRWLRSDIEEEELENMIRAKIEFNQTTKHEKKFDVLGNIRKQEFYKPILLMMHMHAITQICGAPVTATFTTTIIELIVNPNVNAEAWMVFLDIERILVSILAIFVVNKIKRRTMVLTTTAICTASIFGIACYVYAKTLGLLTHDILWIPAVLMFIQFFTMAIGPMSMTFIIAGEVFPLRYRSIGGTISFISTSANIFWLLKTFPVLVASIGISGTYLLYAILMVYCLIVIWFLLPETKDKTLQEIEDEYRGKMIIKDEEEIYRLKNVDNEKS
ncbi:unnamed protein product [Arctia plantaginis]|uniref:Major facilitator superfamily (MFS) profile domain-containing protein n=1 Tax=Arctia plantaginis TaxID=874455 RepID=A0A8S1BIB8_ARCPL|nr:unnamed protein product [Arctia plantaginis]